MRQNTGRFVDQDHQLNDQIQTGDLNQKSRCLGVFYKHRRDDGSNDEARYEVHGRLEDPFFQEVVVPFCFRSFDPTFDQTQDHPARNEVRQEAGANQNPNINQ